MFTQNRSSRRVLFLIVFLSCKIFSGFCQTNFLLNGNFEDINKCKEYNAECGVKAWFYLSNVKVQMIHNEEDTAIQGANSFALFYEWKGNTNFTPIIGTILPCNLQKGKQYIFKGWLSARLHPKLILKPSICTGEWFYVPQRPFSKDMKPDSITKLSPVPKTPFFEFEYSFIANGEERYLTFGTFVNQDTVGGKRNLLGGQTVSIMLDNFSLTSTDSLEIACPAYTYNKERIYAYDYRHKEMDYTLYGKGKLPVALSEHPDDNITKFQTPPPPPVKPDTLKLGDVLFDFNKAALKASASIMLEAFFKNKKDERTIDSIYIEGHTDSVGSDTKNILLSQQRSESVMQWMITNNILPDDKIAIHAFGRSRPVSSNKTPAGRALNRRVEIIIFRQQNR